MDARTQGEIREHLEGRIAKLRERSRQLEDQLKRVEATDVRDSADKAVAAKQDELLGQSVHSNRVQMQQIEAALERMNRGDYGTCVDCEEPIAKGRLIAEPHATRCAECQERLERRGGAAG
jgi:RNA polymerase-binding protein DksA